MAETRFVRTWIDSDLLAAEPALAQMAWVENRDLSPLERTEEFAHEYARKVRRYVARKNGGSAGKSTPLAAEFAMNPLGVMNALWRARAEADRFGVPYDVYLDAVIDGHMDQDKWNRPPRPNQLYGKLAGPRIRGWPTQEDIRIRLACMDDARFGADAYRGDPVQEAALALLRSDVLNADAPDVRLAVYLFDQRRITEDRARTLVGPELVDAVISQKGHPTPPTLIPTAPFLLSCMGHYQSDQDQACGSCPVRMECQSLAQQVVADLIRVTGTENPRIEHKRQVDRERQRRHRAKARKTARKRVPK